MEIKAWHVVFLIYIVIAICIEREKKLPPEKKAPKRKLFQKAVTFDEDFSRHRKRGVILFFTFLGIRYLLPYVLLWLENEWLWFRATEVQYALTLAVVLALSWRFLLEGIKKAWKHCAVRLGQATLIWVIGLALQVACTIFMELGLKLVDSNQEAISATEVTAWWFITSVFVAPIAEELIYRGWLFRFFRNRFRVGAHVINGVAFGVMHVSQQIFLYGQWDQLIAVIPLMITGVAFSIIYEKTGNITYPILGHMMLNLVATLN